MDKVKFKIIYKRKKIKYFSLFLSLILFAMILLFNLIRDSYQLNLYIIYLVNVFTIFFLLIFVYIYLKLKVTIDDENEWFGFLFKHIPDIKIPYTTKETFVGRLLDKQYRIIQDNVNYSILQHEYTVKIKPHSNISFLKSKCTYEQTFIFYEFENVSIDDLNKIRKNEFRKFNKIKQNIQMSKNNRNLNSNFIFTTIFIVIICNNFDSNIRNYIKMKTNSHDKFGSIIFIGYETSTSQVIFNYYRDERYVYHCTLEDIGVTFPIINYNNLITEIILGYNKKFNFNKLIRNTKKDLL